MSGTREGALKHKARRLKQDPDFYRRIGAIGGQKSKRHLTHEEAAALGRLGGRRGKRGKAAPEKAV